MDVTTLDVVDPFETNFVDFYFEYLLKNKPCIFKNSLTSNWKSRLEWTKLDDNTKPDFKKLQNLFPSDEKIPVSDCDKQSDYGDSSNCSTMTLSEYIDTKLSSPSCQSLYLKDWHFQKQFPDYHAYELPVYFQSDWLNEFWDYKNDSIEIDYRFVYLGYSGTWTPYHADVFRSFSWSANVCGRKLWYLTAPLNENQFRLNHYQLITDIRRALNERPSSKVMKIVQEPGEIIFIPSNWHHQVHNLEDTISINHNWFNATNVNLVWEYLCLSLKNVKKEICDLQDVIEDWPDHCQKILKADIGMNYEEFFQLLLYIRDKRRETLLSSTSYLADEKQLLFDKIIIDNENKLKVIWRNRCVCQPKISFSKLCSSCKDLLANYDLEISNRLICDVLENEDFKTLSCYKRYCTT